MTPTKNWEKIRSLTKSKKRSQKSSIYRFLIKELPETRQTVRRIFKDKAPKTIHT